MYYSQLYMSYPFLTFKSVACSESIVPVGTLRCAVSPSNIPEVRGQPSAVLTHKGAFSWKVKHLV